MKRFWETVKKGLFGMHLWLPIAYSLVFLVIAAISQVLGTSWPFYFIGLSVSLLGSLVLAYLTLSKPAAKEPRREDIPVVRPEPARSVTSEPPKSAPRPAAVRPVSDDYVRTENAAARVSDEQTRYSQTMTARPENVSGDLYTAASPAGTTDLNPPDMRTDFMRPDAMKTYYGDAVVPDSAAARSAHDELYPSSPYSADGRRDDRRREERQGPAFSPYVQPVNAASANAAHIEDYDSGRRAHRGEKPTVYRTRKDPNILVYEYTDCYEKYYMNPDGTLTYLSTEIK